MPGAELGKKLANSLCGTLFQGPSESGSFDNDFIMDAVRASYWS